MSKKRRWAKGLPVFAFASLLLFSAVVSYAVPIKDARRNHPARGNSRLSLGISTGYGLFSNSHIGSSPALGASFSLALRRNLAIELAGSFLKAKTENDPQTFYKGSLTAVPLQLSLVWRFAFGRKLTPYALAGGSYFLNHFSLDSTMVDAWNGVGMTLTEKVNNAPGFHFGAGMDYSLNKTLSVGLDVRYFLAKTKGSWSIRDNSGALETAGSFAGVSLNALVGSIALKYFFK